MDFLKQVPAAFARDYAEARSKFLAACAEARIACQSFKHPLNGPKGEVLATDVALVGPEDAENLLVVISGTHGVEGLAGSGCQLTWLTAGGPQAMPADTAVLLVHLINPWGCAWKRRQTEDNIDLNRNFLPFEAAAELPANPDYRHVHPLIMAGEEKSWRNESNLAAALFAGQYEHEDGVGFGGTEPCWSHRTLKRILAERATCAARVSVIDIHTGLGPYGYGSLLSTEHTASPAFRRARDWYGPAVTSVVDDPAAPYKPRGDLMSWVGRVLPAEVTAIVLEVGTFEIDSLLRLQVEDCRVEKFGAVQSAEGRSVREALTDFFFPSRPDWRQSAAFRCLQLIQQSLAGLSPP